MMAGASSRGGNDLTKRFRFVRDAVLNLPCRSAIIDAEVVCCDDDDRPGFDALMVRSTENLCCWCFDLLSLDGRDLRGKPLTERKARLRDLLIGADDDTLRYSDEFEDPTADRRGCEPPNAAASAPHHRAYSMRQMSFAAEGHARRWPTNR